MLKAQVRASAGTPDALDVDLGPGVDAAAASTGDASDGV
jgi:hypothetical protein